MKGLKEDFLNIVRSDKAVLVLMILNFLLAMLLLVFSLINLHLMDQSICFLFGCNSFWHLA